jgi:hypothetical protein
VSELVRAALAWAWVGCIPLVLAGSAVQVAVGAGLSVVSGPFLMLSFGAAVGVPTLLLLNVLSSVVATVFGTAGVRWDDCALAAGATIAGCVVASLLPGLPEGALKAMTAGMLVVIALPRPPVPGVLPCATSARFGVGLAGLVTGALTVWTATPGPITPVALARAGRSGAEIRRTMQPISLVGYGAGLAWVGTPPVSAFGAGVFGWLIGATLVGTGVGFWLRTRIDPARVVLVIRVVAVAAAALLVGSLLR